MQITSNDFGIVTTWGSIFVALVTATFWKSFQLEWLGNGTSPSILAHMMTKFNDKELKLMVDAIKDVTENTGKVIFVSIRHFSGKKNIVGVETG